VSLEDQAGGTGAGSAEAWLGLGAVTAAFFGDTRFFLALETTLAGAQGVLGFMGACFEDLTSPNAFLMFCTLGNKIPNALATCGPDLPAFTNCLTRARVASVIVALFRVLCPVPLPAGEQSAPHGQTDGRANQRSPHRSSIRYRHP